MKTPLLSCITPSIRSNMLSVVAQSLKRQDFNGEFEWLIGSPAHLEKEIRETISDMPFRFIPEPPKREGDFYSLNQAYNECFRNAKGELIVSIQDGIWFLPDLLSNIVTHYENNPKTIIGGVGHQYMELVNGRPDICVWQDPRFRADYGSFWEILPIDMEWTIVSIPKQALIDCGGLDIAYDIGCAISEKEANLRMGKLGYRFYLDTSLEYRALKHGRSGGSEAWDKHYQIACKLLEKHIHEINEGTRLKLEYL